MTPKIISLWILMQRFEVYLVLQKLRSLISASQLGAVYADDFVKRKHWMNLLQSEIDSLLQLCRGSALPMCALSLGRLSELLTLQGEGARFDVIALSRGANMACQAAEDELSVRSFFALEPGEAEAWNAKELFGSDVSDKFPTTDYELEEESKCFAVGRYTAAVYHLMRVLDIGICALATSIGAEPANKSWEKILQSIQVKLDDNSREKPDGWKATEKAYSELAAHFRNLKNAWRNYTMHGNERYDKDRAEEIFVHVRAVMKMLANTVCAKNTVQNSNGSTV